MEICIAVDPEGNPAAVGHGSRESREFPWLKFALVVLARDLS